MKIADFQTSPEDLPIVAEPLTPESFKDFGFVISPNHLLHEKKVETAAANQGTAVKFIHISESKSTYTECESQKVPDFTKWNLFRCTPPNHLIRDATTEEIDLIAKSDKLSSPKGETYKQIYLSKVLEQHPFSTQTFLPLGQNAASVSYMVICAKTSPFGLPDLNTVRAFIAKGNQAVTYGIGTWHAPMIALSKIQKEDGTIVSNPIDFAVLINENGNEEEDCREVFMDPGVKILYSEDLKAYAYKDGTD